MTQRRDLIGELRRFFHVRQIDPNEGVLLAISGGRDSMALARAFSLWRSRDDRQMRVVALAVDHGLRPEARKEAAFAADTLARWDIRCHVAKLKPPERFPKGALAWARTARYAELERMRAREKLGYIVTAHHGDDLAETFLLRMLRTTSPSPLSGLRPVAGKLLRPLLGVRRADIDRFVTKHGVPFVDDPSNTDRRHPRTRVRHELMPLLEDIAGAGLVERLNKLIGDLADDEQVLAPQAALRAKKVMLSEAALDRHQLAVTPMALARRLLWRFLLQAAPDLDLVRAHIDAAWALTHSNTEVLLDGTRRLRVDGDRIVVAKAKAGARAGTERRRAPPRKTRTHPRKSK